MTGYDAAPDLESSTLRPVAGELCEVYRRLESVRMTKGWAQELSPHGGRLLRRPGALAWPLDGWTFERLRDRSVKWRNRKHRVPLQEGLLVVR